MKEKRIVCIEVSGECRYFRDINTPLLADAIECQQGLYCSKNTAWKPISKGSCKNCKEGRYQGLTREQAIERMAKALEEKSGQMARECLNSDPYNNPLGAKDLAEAALNALLEGHDDEK